MAPKKKIKKKPAPAKKTAKKSVASAAKKAASKVSAKQPAKKKLASASAKKTAKNKIKKSALPKKRKIAAKRVAAGKREPRMSIDLETKGLGPDSAGQSGDLQGLSDSASADSESVDELIEEGNAFEAEAVKGVEDAPDADVSEVTTHEVTEDDVPEEYLDRDE